MSDLISRQAAIDAIRQYSHFDDFDTSVIDEEIAIIAIKDLPSVQPKERCIANITINEEDIERIVKEQVEEIKELLPRRGKWIGYKADDKDWQRDDGSPIFMNCSECHEAVINNGSAHWNFCPNCGSYNGGDSDEKD